MEHASAASLGTRLAKAMGNGRFAVMGGLSTFVAVAFVVAALRLAEGVLMPLAVAVLLSFLLAPLAARIERIVRNRALAVAVVVLLVTLLLGGVGFVVGRQLSLLYAELPQYRSNLVVKARTLRGALGVMGEAAEDLERLERELAEQAAAGDPGGERPAPKVEVVPARPGPVATLRALLAPILGPVGTVGLVAVFTVFMVFQRKDLRDRVIRLSGGRDLSLTTQALDDAGDRVSRYLLTTSLLNALHGTAIGLGLFWIGLPTAFLWGFLSMLLRFIPYLGPWIAASLPIALSLAVFEGWSSTLVTVALFVGVELASNNLLEPWLYGHRTGLSPFGVIVSAVFWTWLWGGVGLLLAIPLTVCLVVLGRYVQRLSFLSVLLADTPALSPETRLYQRLLAGDEDEASSLFEQAARESSYAEALDALALPALVFLARDRARDALDDRQADRMRECLAQIVEDVADEAEPANESLPQASRLGVLCLPARDADDELAARWLSERLAALGFRGSVAKPGLVSEHVERTVEERADAVVISVAGPGAAATARHLCKRLRARLPELQIEVALWADPGGLERARARESADDIHFVATLHDVLELLARSAERLQLRKEAAPPGEPSAALG